MEIRAIQPALSIRDPILKPDGANVLWTRYLRDHVRLYSSLLPCTAGLLFLCSLTHAHLFPQFFEPGALSLHPDDWRAFVVRTVYAIYIPWIACFLICWQLLRAAPSNSRIMRVISVVGYVTILASSGLIGLSHLHPGLLLGHNLFCLTVLSLSPLSLGHRLMLIFTSVAMPVVALWACGFFSMVPPLGLDSIQGGPAYNRIVEWLHPQTQLRALLSTLFFSIFGLLLERWRFSKAKLILNKQLENERLLTAYERLLSQTLTFPASREIMSSGQYRSRKRTVVVIACDIVDYSEWSKEIHTPERITNILSTFFQLFDQHCFDCRAIRIEPLRSQGDSRIAIAGLWESSEFPDAANLVEGPESIEIAAVAAVQTMLDFTASIRNGTLKERLRERNLKDPDLRARVGIHLGDVNKGVICTNVDTQQRAEGRMWFDVWGDAVNVAARLEGLAPPNGVIISSQVLSAVGNRFEHGGLVEHEVKHGLKLKGALVTKALVEPE